MQANAIKVTILSNYSSSTSIIYDYSTITREDSSMQEKSNKIIAKLIMSKSLY